MPTQNQIDKNFYCMDIDSDSVWIAYFAIDSENRIDIKLMKKISAVSVVSDGKANISSLNKIIGKIISATQKHSMEKIENIFLTSNILKINSYIKKISIGIGNNKLVNNVHIKESLDRLKNTLAISLPTDETVLQIIPAQYDVDGRRLDNPIGFKTSEMITTYNVVTANTLILDAVKTMFEKFHQIKISDIISHHQALELSLLTAEEKMSGTMIIDIKNGSTNISLTHRNKLVKCISEQNSYQIESDISDYNLYNIMQHVKSRIPEIILNATKNIVIHGDIDSNMATNNIAARIFEKNCRISNVDFEDANTIKGLIKYASEQIINEKNYWGISNEKLNIINLLKNIIDENL